MGHCYVHFAFVFTLMQMQIRSVTYFENVLLKSLQFFSRSGELGLVETFTFSTVKHSPLTLVI